MADIELDIVTIELQSHITSTLNEPGCLVFQVEKDPDNKNRFNVYEEYTDSAAFKAHQNRTLDSTWWKVTTNVERHFEITGLDD